MKQHKYNSKSAFTLVELIVVVIILAILWTIAFISLQGYGKTSRDSVRLSDLSAIKTSLDLFYLDAGKYPLPTNEFAVTYSGTDIWSQWDFWEDTFTNTDKLDKIPVDPLSEKQYVYSITETRQEYQIAGILESDDLAIDTVGTPSAHAWDSEAQAYVTGNYNEVVAKSLSGTWCNLLSVPSIISNQPSTVTDYADIVNNDGLVYRWYRNLPYKYQFSKFKHDGWFGFQPQKLVVYQDDQWCSGIYDPEDNSSRLELMLWLRDSYSGTILKNTVKYTKLVNFNALDETAMDVVWNNFINNTFKADLKVRVATPRPPVIRDIPNISVANGWTVNLDLSNYVWFTNGDAITSYDQSSGSFPTGVSLNTTSWVISGTTSDTWVHTIWVTASDKDGASDEFTFTITVDAPADATIFDNQFDSNTYGRWKNRAAINQWTYKHYGGNNGWDYSIDNSQNIQIDFNMKVPSYQTNCFSRMNVWIIEIADMRSSDSCGMSYRPLGTWKDYIRLRTASGWTKVVPTSNIFGQDYNWSYQLKSDGSWRIYRNGSLYRKSDDYGWPITMPGNGPYNMFLHNGSAKVTTSYITIKNPVTFSW